MIRSHIIHLMRGEIYDIYGKTFFTFGGARSHDIRELATDKELEFDYTAGVLQPDDPNLKHKMKMLDDLQIFTRTENVDWWRQEIPSAEEMNHGMENLRNHGNNVDFIVTHDGPQSDVSMLGENDSDPLREYLKFIRQTVEYRKWLFRASPS